MFVGSKFKPILTVCMRLEVVSDSSKESLLPKVDTQHANDRASFQIANMVEDLVHLESIPDGHFDGMGRPQRVEMKCLLHTLSL